MIRIAAFKGELPRIHPRILPEDAAQVAINTRLEDGTLTSLNEARLVHTFSTDTVSFYKRPDGVWMGWHTDVDAVPGPVAELRTYVTGDGAPRVIVDMVAGQNYPLALDPPSAAPVIAVDSGVEDTDTAEITYYAYTFVTELDEESQPSPLSNELMLSTNQTVSVDITAAAPAGRGIDRVRVYRSQTNALGTTNLYFVSELTLAEAAAAWVHDLDDDPLQEPIESLEYDPPVDGLRGIVACANGIMAGFDGRDLYFSEPYRPHAWPTKYSLTMDFPIVGLAALGSSVVIMTEGTPYIAQGLTPDAMVNTRIEQNLPCVSQRGIVDLGYSVAYPSTEGLVVISPTTGAQMMTRGLFTRKQWHELHAETFVAGQHIGRYVVSHNVEGESGRSVKIIDLSGEQPYLIQSSETAESMYFEIGTGSLFMRVNDREIYEWDDINGEPKEQVWRSRLNHLPGYTNYGAILIETDTPGTVPSAGSEVRVYADGVLTDTVTKFNEIERLSSGFLALKWEIEYRGTDVVTAISMGGTPTEIGGGV